MVLNKNIKAFSATVMFIGFIICFSCEDMETVIINCKECVPEEPDNAELEIKLEEARNMELTTVRIYIGAIEDSLLYKTLKTVEERILVIVPLNETYTLAATYHIDETNFVAINMVAPHVKYFKSQCINPCYYIDDRTVNLKLNYLY